MEGFLPIFFLGVVLKVPVFGALYLIYWAARAEPEPDEAPDDGDHGFRRWRSSRAGRAARVAAAPPARRQPLPDCPPSGRFRSMRRQAPATVPSERNGERTP